MMIRKSKAFTMFEMIIVIALIGVVMAFIIPRMMKVLGKKETAEISFKFAAIKEAIIEYRTEFGSFPTTKEGLRALVENPHPNDDRFKRAEAMNWWPKLKEDQIKQGAVEFEYQCPPAKKGKFRNFVLMYLPSGDENDPKAVIDGD